MRMLVAAVSVLLLLVAACSESDAWRAEAATAIGDELATRLTEPLAQAADAVDESGHDRVGTALDTALDDMTLPPGVYRIVRGTHASSAAGGGYANVSLPLVVVPTDTTSMFCMVFAYSSTGELVAEPAPGDAKSRCADTEKARLTQP